jgi:glycosyltransferase involved in cell wall biosynthesis
MSTPIKVAHVVYGLDVGGVTNVIHQLFANPEPGIEQVLILLREDIIGPEFDTIKVYKLDYISPSDYTLSGFAKLIFSPAKYFGAIADRLYSIWEKEKFTVFHFHGLPKDLPIGKMLQKKEASIKLFYTDHLLRISREDYNSIKGKILAKIYKRFYKPYHTIFVSRSTFEIGKEFGFVSASGQNTFIENSISTSSIQQKFDYSISGKTKIVYVSRISAVKGHFILLTVAEILINKYKFSDFKITLIGPGELSEDLQQKINERGLSSYFELAGSKQQVTSLLPAFDIAVFPSEREGLPIALLEKMAAGLPVVASDIPEIKNVIQHENEALLFQAKNAEACAAQLYTLINNLKLRETIGAAARKAVEERYAKPLIEKYLEFYKEVLENN